MWHKDAISEGEIDALHRAALAACNEDTRYPAWRGSHRQAGGECHNIAHWLVSRLGGHVGAQLGHYAWLSPDDRYVIDLTGKHRGTPTYAHNHGRFHAVDQTETDRTRRFCRRADRIFDNLDRLLRLSLDYAGDAYPAEEPQAADNSDRFNDSWSDPDQYWHDEPGTPTTPEGQYQFVYANGQLEISPNHSHEELSEHAGVVPAQHRGPFAAGHVVVTSGRATWEVHANINLHGLFRIFKDATKSYGWTWGGMTDSEGQPIIEDFAPKKSATTLHYVYVHDHLYLGRTSAADLAVSTDRDDGDGRAVSGSIRIVGDRAWVDMADVDVLPHLFDWAADSGLTLYAGNDNVIRTIPDLQQGNNYNPETTESPNPAEPQPVDERLPTGLYRCPACDQLFPNWDIYQRHRREQESWGDPDRSNNGDRGLPEPDPGQFGDGAHFTEMRQTPGITTGNVVVLPARTWKEAARVDGFTKYATAFGYNNDSHRFYVAYRDGDPLGYAAVKPDGGVTMMHAIIEHVGVGRALYAKLTQHYDALYTHAAHAKTEAILRKRGWTQSKGQLWKWAKDQAATDLLEAPLPFIYDVESDKISVGHPGARTSDIPGKFTPGGIVEGNYEPGGKVVIRSLTSTPYTVRHMIELWYYSQPQLEVKSVHLQDDAGKDTRLASVASQVQLLAAMDPAVDKAAKALTYAGGNVYAVGGAVRNTILGVEADDVDLMVTGLPEKNVTTILKALPGHVVHEGKDFKVFHYWLKGRCAHIALPRKERSTGEGHKDFAVKSDPDMTPEQDFLRRDFTANAIGVHLASGKLIDPFNGQRDIKRGVLRTLTAHSLAEDPLRVMRAFVAHARHGLVPDTATRSQLRYNAPGLANLPVERIQQELDKLMKSANPAAGIRLAHETGALAYILPEVDRAIGYDQNNPHHELDLGEHLLKVLERIAAQTTDPDLRLAALLHDIGKPGSAWVDPEHGTNHYYAHHVTDEEGKRTGEVLGAQHEELGAELARKRLGALRYPNDRIDRIVALVGHHMYAGFTTTSGARRFLARVGDHAEDLFLLRWADQGGKDVQPFQANDPAWNVSHNRRLVAKVIEAGEAFDRTGLAITGRDLIEAGIEPGPVMGKILTDLTEQVVADPDLNTRETLLRMAKAFAE